jgi:hypothetical protein
MVHVNARVKVILAAVWLACSAPVHGTTQRPEIVLINGGVYGLPMDGIKNVPPLSLWRFWRDTRNELGVHMLSTACYRGYVGIWEVHEDHLYLRGLHGWTDRKGDVKLDLKTIFPEQFKDGRVEADWFDGEATVTNALPFNLDGGWRTLGFAEGKVVSPATTQRLGVEDPVRAKPPRQGRMPPGPKDYERRMPDGSPKPQMPDIFIMNGAVYYLPAEFSERAFSRESLWKDRETRPALSHRPDGANSFGFTRGYRAVWEVHEDSFYLLALEAWTQGQKAHLKALFPDRFQNGRVRADWYSGDLALISDENLPWLATVRKQDPPLDAPKIMLTIKDGNVVSVKYTENETEARARN